MGPLGTTELIIILIIIVVLFGVGRISKLGSEMGKGISAFRDGMKEGQEGKDEDDVVEKAAEDTEVKEA